MKLKSLMALTCLAGLLCVSCSKNEDGPKSKPDQPQNAPIKKLSFITQEKTLEDYDKWVYVNLETGETVMKEDVSGQEWRTYSEDGKQKDQFGKYNITKTVEERPSNAPAKWHLAFHIYDVRTNNGEGCMTDTTDIETIKSLPTNVKWVSDIKAYLIYDMKGMMKKPVVMGYMKNYVNMGLYYWMHKPVFLVRFKDGSYAIIQFTSLKDATGRKKEVSFNYKFIKKN